MIFLLFLITFYEVLWVKRKVRCIQQYPRSPWREELESKRRPYWIKISFSLDKQLYFLSNHTILYKLLFKREDVEISPSCLDSALPLKLSHMREKLSNKYFLGKNKEFNVKNSAKFSNLGFKIALKSNYLTFWISKFKDLKFLLDFKRYENRPIMIIFR